MSPHTQSLKCVCVCVLLSLCGQIFALNLPCEDILPNLHNITTRSVQVEGSDVVLSLRLGKGVKVGVRHSVVMVKVRAREWIMSMNVLTNIERPTCMYLCVGIRDRERWGAFQTSQEPYRAIGESLLRFERIRNVSNSLS